MIELQFQEYEDYFRFIKFIMLFYVNESLTDNLILYLKDFLKLPLNPV